MALRSHVASGTALAADCMKAPSSPAGSDSSMKNAIRFLVLTAWYLASMGPTARPSRTTLRATVLRSSEKYAARSSEPRFSNRPREPK